MNSITYHPGLRNHPNFRYENPSNQANPNFQGSQGNFVPRQPFNNQGGYRGGNNQGFQRQYQTGQEHGVSSGGNKLMEMLKAKQIEMQKRNQMDDARIQKDEIREKAIQSLTTQMGQLATEVADLKKELCTQKKQQKVPKWVNLTERVSAVLKGDLTPKLQDPGMPLINIQVGNFQMARALLDLGAGVSILPGGLYDQYDFGPLKRVQTMVLLVDLSHKLPRGIVQDVIVKVDELYYPVDFLVLDYSFADPIQQQNVIFGRPVLNTAHAVIDCRYSTVDMAFGNRKMRLNVFTHGSSSFGGDECFLADIIDGCDPHEYEEDMLEPCVYDCSLQVYMCALRLEEKEQEALVVKEGRPPWTHQVENLPVEIDSGTKPSLECTPQVELKELPKHLKYAFFGEQ
ncbi:uncharacterized protein LOC110931326 [Helianthus annuus]|uniref:uncharacterized protein LOC110931326 n=1 Tax=Helianthus annuus TaxID=4232 RepID=UPI000B9035D4|nr:uncharacterized protein LOC110931326 [Helianthus annuus]